MALLPAACSSPQISRYEECAEVHLHIPSNIRIRWVWSGSRSFAQQGEEEDEQSGEDSGGESSQGGGREIEGEEDHGFHSGPL